MLHRCTRTIRRTLSTQRRPALRDLVVLAPGLEEKAGLKAGDVAKIIADESKTDPATPFRLKLPDSLECPWVSADDVVLLDPLAAQPPPEPPASHECCGSSCPNCVWITHWEACQAWEKEQQQTPTQPM
ncbi:hypothetical protein LEN26_010448 [Aphanomyces euteiches]|nr:hypothetical protein LEN26_010448 [Aphanomyces euteiches]